MAGIEKKLDALRYMRAEAAVDRGVAFIRERFGIVGLRRLAGGINIISDKNCALALASRSSYSKAVVWLKLSYSECESYGFNQTREYDSALLSQIWRTKVDTLQRSGL